MGSRTNVEALNPALSVTEPQLLERTLPKPLVQLRNPLHKSQPHLGSSGTEQEAHRLTRQPREIQSVRERDRGEREERRGGGVSSRGQSYCIPLSSHQESHLHLEHKQEGRLGRAEAQDTATQCEMTSRVLTSERRLKRAPLREGPAPPVAPAPAKQPAGLLPGGTVPTKFSLLGKHGPWRAVHTSPFHR